MAPNSKLVQSGLALLGVGALGLAGCVVESRAYVLRYRNIPALPKGARPLRILHLSDLHLTPGQKLLPSWVRGLARFNPDLVINTGDNLAHRDAVPAALHALEPLLCFPGAFVLGSNDYFAAKLKNPARYLLRHGGRRRITGERLPTAELIAGFEAGGWRNLNNRREELEVAGHRLEFVGVDDPHLNYDRFPAAVSATGAMRLGVLHAPYRRVLHQMVADGVQVILAGHTHGGQLRLPGVGALVTNCDLDRRRARGLSRWWPGAEAESIPPTDAAWLHVSAGLGTSPYAPVRFCCRPEATLLTLTPG